MNEKDRIFTDKEIDFIIDFWECLFFERAYDAETDTYLNGQIVFRKMLKRGEPISKALAETVINRISKKDIDLFVGGISVLMDYPKS